MDSLDQLDRQMINALSLDGRASFSRIADVLGVSDQTIARRYRRLRTAGALRIVAMIDPRRVGYDQWYLRLRCAPDAATDVAAALARRPDTFWVDMTSGGTEITCVTHPRTRAERDSLLLRKLPHTRQVTNVSAHYMLQIFNGGAAHWCGLDGGLSAEQVARLRVPVPVQRDAVTLDDGDTALLAVLGRDVRAPHGELAAATGWSESTVRRRMEYLRECGAWYHHIDMDSGLLGYRTEANLWMSVPPSDLAATGHEIARHPEVPFVAATTGPTNLVASVVCADVDDLYRYLNHRLGAIPAIRHLETAPVIRTFKRAGALL